MSKINCPFHDDSTASCHVYEDGYHCFGCGSRGPLTELGLAPTEVPRPKFIEDAISRRKEIGLLPQKMVRGVLLHCDSKGFYIVWPDSSYYKYRLFEPGPKDPKYKGPSGHKPPLFWARRLGYRSLIIVEGELNAISVSYAISGKDVCSPGSASNFSENFQRENLTQYQHYDNITIVVDRDPAGVIAARDMKVLLMSCVPYVSIVLMERDANEILINEGPDRLKEELQKTV